MNKSKAQTQRVQSGHSTREDAVMTTQTKSQPYLKYVNGWVLVEKGDERALTSLQARQYYQQARQFYQQLLGVSHG